MNQKPTVQSANQIKQLNFKVQEDFYWKLKDTAGKQRLKMIEVLEKAWKFYEQREQIINEINICRQTIPIIEKQMQPFQGKLSWAELESRLNNLDPVSFNKNWFGNYLSNLEREFGRVFKVMKGRKLTS